MNVTREQVIAWARQADLIDTDFEPSDWHIQEFKTFAALAYAAGAKAENEALETELLKLKKGIAGPTDYIQGRWDLIGEFQDVIRARRQE